MENLTYKALANLAGYTEESANHYGLCRTELENIILNSKN